jgi:RNA polymerase sigma-70 factor (ECF subfamily)
MLDDRELIERVRAGDLQAFGELYDRYRRPVFHTALAITHDPQAAEEILQDCFVRAHRHIDRIDTSLPLSPWLHRITVNLSYNWATRRKSWLVSLDEVVGHLASAARSLPERVTEQRELQRIVQEAIAELSFNHRAVVVLYFLQGFSLAEIAYILDCPEGTVKSRLHYACKKLRHRLGREILLEPSVGLEFL